MQPTERNNQHLNCFQKCLLFDDQRREELVSKLIKIGFNLFNISSLLKCEFDLILDDIHFLLIMNKIDRPSIYNLKVVHSFILGRPIDLTFKLEQYNKELYNKCSNMYRQLQEKLSLDNYDLEIALLMYIKQEEILNENQISLKELNL